MKRLDTDRILKEIAAIAYCKEEKTADRLRALDFLYTASLELDTEEKLKRFDRALENLESIEKKD